MSAGATNYMVCGCHNSLPAWAAELSSISNTVAQTVCTIYYGCTLVLFNNINTDLIYVPIVISSILNIDGKMVVPSLLHPPLLITQRIRA